MIKKILQFPIQHTRFGYRLYYYTRYCVYGWYVVLPYYRYLAKKQGKILTHFIHINKNGGTSVKYAFQYGRGLRPYCTPTHIVFLHKHEFTLKRVRKGEKVFFFLRDPIDRFISGFNYRYIDRKRNIATALTWNEKKLFQYFTSANELAEALSSEDTRLRRLAYRAMKQIKHVRTSYWDWFISPQLLETHKNAILYIGWQQDLDAGILKIKQLIDAPDADVSPQDEFLRRKTKPYIVDLSELAIKNLRIALQKEYECIACIEQIYPNLKH